MQLGIIGLGRMGGFGYFWCAETSVTECFGNEWAKSH